MSNDTGIAETSIGPSDASVSRGKTDSARGFSRPDPEQGLRLMRIFLSIREPSLRQAVIRLVTELSAPDDERR